MGTQSTWGDWNPVEPSDNKKKTGINDSTLSLHSCHYNPMVFFFQSFSLFIFIIHPHSLFYFLLICGWIEDNNKEKICSGSYQNQGLYQDQEALHYYFFLCVSYFHSLISNQ